MSIPTRRPFPRRTGRDDQDLLLLKLPKEEALEEVLPMTHNDFSRLVRSLSVNEVKGGSSGDCKVLACSSSK